MSVMCMTNSYYLVSAIVLLCGSWYAKRIFSTRARLPFPPGPPRHWLFGNQFPTSRAPFVFAKMTEQYGPVFSLRRGGRMLVIIGRYQAAMDIMEKQGASLADRPRSIAAAEILNGGLSVFAAGIGDRLRKVRSALHAALQPKVAATYEPVQVRYATNMLLDIMEDSKNHQMHSEKCAVSVIMSITYGKTTPTAYNDPEVVTLNHCLKRFVQVIRPGAYLVDIFPILRYIPGYLAELKKWHQEELALFQRQLDIAREQMRKDDAQPCIAKSLLENQIKYGFGNDQMAYLAGSMFAAGVDTTATAIQIIMMAAALHPEAQARVQEELDSVVGRERLPSFSDQDMLPQLNAFTLECERWRPVTIGGFAHRATADIVWNNLLIPEGAIVIGNHWAIANDPEVFPNPEKFDPQRWLTTDGKVRNDLRFCTFGFGRRICAGLHVANRSVFINAVSVLWAFHLSENPAAPIDSFAFYDGINLHAMPFELVFKTRSPEENIKKLCMVSLDGDL